MSSLVLRLRESETKEQLSWVITHCISDFFFDSSHTSYRFLVSLSDCLVVPVRSGDKLTATPCALRMYRADSIYHVGSHATILSLYRAARLEYLRDAGGISNIRD